MGKIIACTGKYAKTAYEVERFGCKVFSLEELADCLMENAELLDKVFISRSLTDWLSQECGLRELSDQLREAAKRGEKAAYFVSLILEASGLYEKKEIDEVKLILQEKTDENPIIKKKKRADYLIRTGKYGLACRELSSILTEVQGKDRQTEANTVYKLGLCNVAMFRTESAAEQFLCAYHLIPDTLYLKSYMKCQRMLLPEGQYLRKISEIAEAGTVSLEVEREWEVSQKEWEEYEKLQSEEYTDVVGRHYKDYDELRQQVYRMKEDFMKFTEVF